MTRPWWGWASRGMTPEQQRAVRVARERQIIAAASEQIFRFDLSDPATWPGVEAVMAGAVSSLRALGTENGAVK